jgi:hypothetical protein
MASGNGHGVGFTPIDHGPRDAEVRMVRDHQQTLEDSGNIRVPLGVLDLPVTSDFLIEHLPTDSPQLFRSVGSLRLRADGYGLD